MNERTAAPTAAPKGAKPLAIGLSWHTFFSENLGVGALTVANLNLIGDAAHRAGFAPHFHILGSRGTCDYGNEARYPHDFTNIGYKALANPLSDLHRTIRRCDILFDIGAGDSFSDIYGWGRYRLMLGTKFAAILAGVPLVLSPQTIGPFYTPAARAGASLAMRGARHIFARDETSRGVLDDMGMGAKSSLTTDVAFALPFERPADKHGRDLAAGPIRFGLNVSALLYRRDIAAPDKIKLAADYPALIDAILERLTRDPRIELHLVPHVLATQTPYEDDYAVAEMLKQRWPAAILPSRFTGPSEAKTYIAGLDMFSGSRMHATIAALSSDTAVIPLGYSRKFSGLFNSLGYPWNIDLTVEDNAAVLARLDDILTRPGQLQADAMAANAEAQRRLGQYRDFLDRTMQQLGQRHV